MEEVDLSFISDDEYDVSATFDDEDFISCKKSTSGAEDDFKYEVFLPEQIVQFMNTSIDEVNQVLQLPRTTVRILLHHFRWDKEKLMERFFDNDQDAVFREAHIINPHSKLQHQNSTEESKLKKNFCQICFLSYDSSQMTGLLCDHRFCNECWRHYLRTKIVDEGMGQTIACPGHECDIYVDDETVMKLINEPQVLVRYQHLITNSFVECNRLMRWCPAPNCSNAVRVMFFDAKPVRCSCGKLFCFGCGHEWHDPVKCKWLKKWLKKCDDDSETSNWIAANTKECPVCHATIEKNGGCNHVICQNISCRNEFCWVCLGPWKPHGSYWYHCNRFNEDEAKKARDAQEKSRSALQRYLHYYNRYINHFQSLKLENKLYKNVRLKMEEMQYQGMSWIEVQFLKKAVDILLSCRQTLMYTYSFAFYLRRNNQSEVFEQNQADLERATEELSGYLERDVSEDVIYKIKQNVQDKYRYCENRRNVLLDHVHEGYEKDYWSYISD